jgi:hypothetical protein
MVAIRFGLSRKSGNLQTEMAGNFAPKQVETMDRNKWQLWPEIRTRDWRRHFPAFAGKMPTPTHAHTPTHCP